MAGVATRYDKQVANYPAMLVIAALMVFLLSTREREPTDRSSRDKRQKERARVLIKGSDS